MKEMMNFYLMSCKENNNKDIIRTKAYKFGIAEDVDARLKSVKSEWGKYLALTKQNQDGSSVKKETDVELEFSIEGPTFFIKDLESYVDKDYFSGEDRFFTHTKNNSSEYLTISPELITLFNTLLETLKKNKDKVSNLNKGYNQIQDKQTDILSDYKELFTSELSKITSHLSKVMPLKTTTTQATNIQVVNNPVTLNIPKKNVYDYLKSEFKLYKKGSKYFLQHLVIHKGKDPTIFGGSWVADANNPNSRKFQWDQNSEMKKFNYKQGQAGMKSTLEKFGNDIVDLDMSSGNLLATGTSGQSNV